MKKYKVVQWATGYTGIYALKYILLNPALQLVGLKCFTPGKAGKDAGEICHMAPVGVKATMSTKEILKLDADCVVYTPGLNDLRNPSIPGSNSHEMFKTLLQLLESGKNVVTTATPFLDTSFWEGGDIVRGQIERACAKGNTSFFATGCEPGFMADVLPLTLASACGGVTKFKATEALDYSGYTAYDTLKTMGIGCRPEELSAGGLETIHLTWGCVPAITARALGVKLDDIKTEADIYLAPESFSFAGGVIEKGTVAGVLFRVIGIVGGKEKIVLEHITRMRNDMAPEWANVGPNGGYRVEIEGTTALKCDVMLGLPGGEGSAFDEAMAMTAARAVNAVEAVVQASPGFKTILDLPPLLGKYTMHAD